MAKIFFSHSSRQKNIVNEVVDRYIGRDFSVVDSFAFDAGKKLTDEIKKSISTSDVFVLFISNESLESEWVKEELIYVRDFLDMKTMTFCPFIVDKNIEVSDDRIRPWIKDYLLKIYESPGLIAHIIRGCYNKHIVSQGMKTPAIAKSVVFEGRDRELQQLGEKYFTDKNILRRAVIVSGMQHIGRKRLLKEAIVRKFSPKYDESYEPIIVSLTDSDSIDIFINQIAEYIATESAKSISQRLIEKPESAVNVCVDLLNRIAEQNIRIIIDDNGSIVRYDGNIVDWFKELLRSSNLINQTHFYIASRIRPKISTEEYFDGLVQVTPISPMDQKQIRTLFNAYSMFLDVQLSSPDADYFISKLTGYPEQVYAIVDTLLNSNINTVKGSVDFLTHRFDKDLDALFNYLKSDSDAVQLLVILTHFEFINVEQLHQIYDNKDKLNSLIEQFENFSLFETFGLSRQYIRLSHNVSDFIDRKRLPLTEKYNTKIQEFTSNIIKNIDDNSLDFATYLYGIKEMLIKGQIKISRKIVLPSYANKAIFEQYKGKKYNEVIDIADNILNYYNVRAYKDILYSIRYWKCLAMCRLGNEELHKEVRFFKDEHPSSYHFLLGFYYRLRYEYPKAKDHYEAALKCAGGSDAKYITKAINELAIINMKQGHYDEAVKLVEMSIKGNDSINPYIRNIYFRSLVRSRKANATTLANLKNLLSNSSESDKDLLLEIFEAEEMFYLNGTALQAIDRINNILDECGGYIKTYAFEALKPMYEHQNSSQIYENLKNKHKYSEKDEQILFEM